MNTRDMKQIDQRALAHNETFGASARITHQVGQRVWVGLAAFFFAARLALGADTSNPPQLTQVSPTSGVAGDRVRIDGDNLATTAKVEFNGVSAQFNVYSFIDSSIITASVPAGATTGPIKVTTSYGTAMTTDPFVVLPGNAPAIDSFSPASGPPGTRIVITGQNLKYTTSVLLSGVAIQWSPGIDPMNVYLNASIPTNATTGPITVSSTFGSTTTTTNFTVTAPPPITVNYWPTWLEAGFGDMILVNDSSQVTNVQLNGLSIPYTVRDLLTVYLGIPTNAQTGVMTVFTPNGSVSSPDQIPVYPYPVANSLDPNSGRYQDTIKVLGQNLDVVSWVQIGSNSIPTSVAHVDSGTISFFVRDDATSGEVFFITKKSNTIDTGLLFYVTSGSGIITTRTGTISGHTPTSAPTPITGITNLPPSRTVGTTDATGTLVQPALLSRVTRSLPVLSIVSAGNGALKVTWRKLTSTGVLESSASSVGGEWTPVPLSSGVNQEEYQLVVPAKSTQQFFRLRMFPINE